ncbi:hypothetical protein ACFV1L_21955 [Kitasatospora sp. NPDC059646]|uniref:hypothetical protein n=1 Tax=Kitasatospora sp. NPDC059646 TaxID=3346893 RepID=UPI0036ACD02E
MSTIVPAQQMRAVTGTGNGANSTTGRTLARRIVRATSNVSAELWLAGGDLDQELAHRLADLTGVDAELWEQRDGEAREVYLDRAASAILDTNPDYAALSADDELSPAVAEAVAITRTEGARIRLLAEAARIEAERNAKNERSEAARVRRAAGVEQRLSRAAQRAAEFELLDRTNGEPDDPTWSAAELRGVQKHSPFRSGPVYRFRRTDGTLASVVA